MTNRRGFLGRLMGGTAVAAFAPKLALETEPLPQFVNCCSTAEPGTLIAYAAGSDKIVGVVTDHSPDGIITLQTHGLYRVRTST